jgi:hypothetical protein
MTQSPSHTSATAHPMRRPGGKSLLEKRFLLGALFLALIAYMALAVLPNPRGTVLALLSDDSFYYFEIARNIVSGTGCTFDGIAETNGFHPLWLLLLLVPYAVLGEGLLAPLVAVLLIDALLAALTFILLYRIVDEYVAPGYGILAVGAALLPNLSSAMVNGLETGLQLFLLCLTIYLSYRHGLFEPRAGRGKSLFLGFLLGVVTLSRLDSVFLVVAAAALVLAARNGSNRWRRLVFLFLGYAIPIVPYAAFNLLRFGHLTPTSGMAKSSFPHLVRSLAISGDETWGMLMLTAMGGMLIAASVINALKGRARSPLLAPPLVMIAMASLFHFLHVFLFLAWGVYWWHFTMYGLGIVLVLPAFVQSVFGPVRRWRYPVVVAMALIFLSFAAWTKVREIGIKGRQHAGWLQAAEWARDHTGPRDVLAIADAGLFGYFSERNVINLDGKANGYDYLRHVESGRLLEYLQRAGTRYVANIRVRYDSGRYRIPVARVDKPSLGLVLRESWEVYRGPPIPSDAPRFGPVGTSHFVIWRLPANFSDLMGDNSAASRTGGRGNRIGTVRKAPG